MELSKGMIKLVVLLRWGRRPVALIDRITSLAGDRFYAERSCEDVHALSH
jgi:hypothetical protein